MNSTVLKSLLLASLAGFGMQVQAQSGTGANCGYQLDTGVRAVTPKGFVAWARIANVNGPAANHFKVLLEVGGGTLKHGTQVDIEAVEGGYEATSPDRFTKKPLKPGEDFTFTFLGDGPYLGAKPYMLSVNGVSCDTAAPAVWLNVSQALFTSPGTLTLNATASDNAAVSKVVFARDGEVIGEVTEAPFTLTVAISDADNGRSRFTATAYDPSGNTTTTSESRVFAAIGNRFLGTAPGSNADFVHANTYFNQITPEDASKWGSVEATRDVMNWTALDEAYYFAKDNNMPFKLHTLIWGQQSPGWMGSLSAAEQLAEIEEWMSLLAQRYPDVEMIDVVNEPLHAPPVFTEALGGAGETGWDWVVKSYELARQYFPDAQLLLNDYQVLIREDFSHDYLEVITPLLERDLIDGIGVQAHFLERADNAVVAASLANLAATGLPIYVAEFDVNIADDAHHANRVRDLFTVFWNNPSVVGVTHWGHLQGDVWRQHAYLIRQDGTLRPGFEWMLCYYAGGSDCTVPEYIPGGWSGNQNGLLLEAEEYDSGEGVVGTGDVIAYADDGSWIGYKGVQFQETWNLLSLTYLKGNDSVGSVSFHLDSLNATPLLEINLPGTGGWGTADTLVVEWPAFSGEHDLYVRFNGGPGIANLDSIRLHPPLEEPGFGPNLITNPGFEDGTTNGWFTWDGMLNATMEFAYDGYYSLELSNRSGNGPAVYSLMGLVSEGSSYEVSLYASIAGANSASVNVTSKIGCAGSDSYSWLVNPVTITEGQWVQLKAQLSVPNCDLSDLLIYAEGPAGGVDILIDEFSVREVAPENLLTNGGFEDGNAAGWFSWDGTVGISDSQVKSGNYALQLSGRSGNGPAAYNLTSLVTPGTTYNLSMAASILGASDAPLNITQKIECEGNAQYTWLANTGSVSAGDWVTLSGSLVVPDCDLTDLLIYVEGPGGGVDIYLDDVQLTVE